MITFRVADTKYDHGWCVLIRTLVFVVEQNVDVVLEVDEHENVCRHILGIDDAQPFATARWRRYKPTVAEIERVAVLKNWRGKKLGTGLLAAVATDIRNIAVEIEMLRLGAQDYAIPFYEKKGFRVIGDGFLDANIPHHIMEKPVSG